MWFHKLTCCVSIINGIVMTVDDCKSVVIKGVTHGACDYLIMPVRIEALEEYMVVCQYVWCLTITCL